MSATSAERLSRLLALVPWLAARDGITIDEAAQHFSVTPEQLEKDLWLLVVCGLPGYGPDQLVDIDFWDDGRIHVIDPQTLKRPLRLSADEAMSLLVALRVLAQVPGDHDRAALASAMVRIEEALEQAERPEAIVQASPQVSAEVDAAVSNALRDELDLRITYAAATSDEITEREVRPVSVQVVDGRGYLEAVCFTAQAVRTFRLDRILRASTMPRAARPEPPVPAADAPGPVSPPTLLLSPSARWVADVHPVSSVREAGDGSLEVELQAFDADWVVRLVLSLGGTATVLRPEELRRSVHEAAQRALR